MAHILSTKTGRDFREWYAENYEKVLKITAEDLPFDSSEPLDISKLRILRDYLHREPNSAEYIVDGFLFNWINQDRELTPSELTELLNVFKIENELACAVGTCIASKRVRPEQVRDLVQSKLSLDVRLQYGLDVL